MKMLKKLALVSAISAISVSAFAMEAMDDEAMATTTGQDGITINIVPDAISRTQAAAMGVTAPTMNAIENNAPLYKGLSIGSIVVHDDDGLGVLGTDATANSGALVIGGGADGATTAQQTADRTVILAKGDKPIQINIDMVGDSNGSAANGGAMLNVEIKQPKMAIKLGNIYVANSNAAEAGFSEAGATTGGSLEVDGTTATSKVKILDGLEIVMNESTMTIQLGNESQGGMIKANATLGGGLTINNFALYDQQGAAALTADNLLTGTVGSGGSIRASSLKITDNGGTDLTTKTMIDVGSRVTASTVTPSGAAETAFKNAQAVKAGQVDYASAPPAIQAAIDAATTYASGLANSAAATAGTWGGVDTYNGLVITSELGATSAGVDIAINNAAVGDINAKVIGDVQIVGLALGKSKIVIMGH